MPTTKTAVCKIIKWSITGLFMITLAIVSKLLLVTLFVVPSASMKSSIYAGEHILVSKLHYGPRWPKQPLDISYFNLLAFFPPFTEWFTQTKWEYKRWPESGHIEHSDVIVFDAPFQLKDKLVKRCVGLPGDTILVMQHQTYVNNQAYLEGDNVHHTSTVLINQPSLLANYGPIIAPYKGQSITLDTANIRFYRKTIKREGHAIETKGDSILIDNQLVITYTFQHNYYFMLGDNRAFSEDSRKWGLVPEENIIGKAVLILWSRDPRSGDIRWARLFNGIN